MKSSLATPSKGFVKEDSSILTPKLKAGITIVSTLTGLLAVWSLVARVPVIVNARGLLIPARGLFTASAPSAGVVVYPFEEIDGKPVFTPPEWSSQAYDYQWGLDANSEESEKVNTIKLARKITDDIADDEWVRFSTKDANNSIDKALVPFKSVVAIVDNSSARSKLLLSLAKYDSEKEAYDALRQKLKLDIKTAKDIAQKNQEIYMRSQSLVPSAMSRSQLLDLEQAWLQHLQKLRDLEQKKLEEDEGMERTTEELSQSLSVYLNQSLVYAWEDAYLSQVMEEQWANVVSGSNLLTLTWVDEISPNVIPIFLDASTFAQTNKGMEVIITPDGFSPAEIGGIKGEIINISPLPKDRVTLANLLGISAASDASFSGVQGAIYLAEVKLETQLEHKGTDFTLFHNRGKVDSDNSGGYKWNNKANPPLPPRTGQKVGVQITTRYQSPASMVLSFLKEAAGLETPEKLNKNN